MRSIYYYDYDNDGMEEELVFHVDRFPDECPICHKGQEPHFVTAVSNPRQGCCEAVFKCTQYHCSKLFFAYYTYSGPHSSSLLIRVQARDLLKESFPENINEVSPNFSKIYNQAAKAEAMELTEVAGMGYRKALEFLIKDYLINFKGHSSEMIISLHLAVCINNYAHDSVKAVASRATWLGNDETHYKKIYDEYNIVDLKTLLKLTVNQIDNEITSKKYVDNIEKKH